MKKHRRKWHIIAELLKDVKNPRGAEIGVHQGQMSENMFKRVPGLFLYLVDSWSKNTYEGKNTESARDKYIKLYQDEWQQNLDKTKKATSKYTSQRKIIRGDSAQSAELVPDNSLDFVFIDADHSYGGCLRDIKAWLPKIKEGGFIAGHDYPRYEGVVQAVNETFRNRVCTDLDHCWYVRL